MKRAIQTHMRDFAAIVVLLVLSVAVADYVLSHERFRFPFIDASPYTLNAEFSTAQAVTPGQGQSVRISGVQVGEIGDVSLKNGVAVVQMNLEPQYQRVVHTNGNHPTEGSRRVVVPRTHAHRQSSLGRRRGLRTTP